MPPVRTKKHRGGGRFNNTRDNNGHTRQTKTSNIQHHLTTPDTPLSAVPSPHLSLDTADPDTASLSQFSLPLIYPGIQQTHQKSPIRSMIHLPASSSSRNLKSGTVGFIFNSGKFAASGNRFPQHGSVFTFALRFPDNIPILFDDPTDDECTQKELNPAADAIRPEFQARLREQGVALVDKNGMFMGWVVDKDTHIIRPKLLEGHVVDGIVLGVTTFLWDGYSQSGICSFVDHSIATR